MKIQLIMPAEATNWLSAGLKNVDMPLATTYLAGLIPNEHQVTAVDMIAGDAVDYSVDAELIGITVRTAAADAAYRVADKFLEQGKTVVLGGPHVTINPVEAKQHASAVVVGEAENIIRQLIDDCTGGTMRAFYVGGPFDTQKLGKNIFQIAERPDFVRLPHAKRNILPRARYRYDSIFTTQGCPYGCAFCSNDLLKGQKIRHRPVDEVINEIETLRPFFRICDDNALGLPGQEDYYVELYSKLASLRRKYYWVGEGGVNIVTTPKGRKILNVAAKSGLSMLHAGFESISTGSNMQAGSWKKSGAKSKDAFDVKQIEKAIRIIQDHNIAIWGNFIVGFDEDTPETFDRTYDFCNKHNIMPIFSILSPYPGTKIYEDYKKAGRILEKMSWKDYGQRGKMVFRHPTGLEQEFEKRFISSIEENYRLKQIWKRTRKYFWANPTNVRRYLPVLMGQLGIKKAIPHMRIV